MITLTREETQQVLDALEEFPYSEGIKTILRAKLSEYPKNQVRPHEFLKAVEGKEEFVGMPIIWAEWPTKEEV